MAKRLLIVEDAPQVANILVSKLTREGYEAVWKRSRSEALAELSASWDLILLSTDLPQRDFWEALRDIKSRTETPVILLLESEEASLEPQALTRGACGVILKPFKPTVVAKRVRELLQASGGLTEAPPREPSSSHEN